MLHDHRQQKPPLHIAKDTHTFIEIHGCIASWAKETCAPGGGGGGLSLVGKSTMIFICSPGISHQAFSMQVPEHAVCNALGDLPVLCRPDCSHDHLCLSLVRPVLL